MNLTDVEIRDLLRSPAFQFLQTLWAEDKQADLISLASYSNLPDKDHFRKQGEVRRIDELLSTDKLHKRLVNEMTKRSNK